MNAKAISMNGLLLNRAVLVLNTNYAPLTITTAKRAICLHVTEKIDIVESYLEEIHSPSITYSLPSVVKLRAFVHYNSMDVILSRRNLLQRDNHTCQYCGKTSGKLTIDHVIPRERGGRDLWENLVIACSPCNLKKNNLTPEEAGMPLLKHPRRPNRIHYFQKFVKQHQTGWKPYLFMETWGTTIKNNPSYLT